MEINETIWLTAQVLYQIDAHFSRTYACGHILNGTLLRRDCRHSNASCEEVLDQVKLIYILGKSLSF